MPRRQRIRRFGPRNKVKRRQQAGTGFNVATELDLGKSAADSKLSKMMTNDAIGYTQQHIKNQK